MVYQCEKQLSDLGDKAPKELKESIDGILADSKKVLEKQDASLTELKEAKDSLQKTFEQLGQEAMKHAGAATGGAVPLQIMLPDKILTQISLTLNLRMMTSSTLTLKL